MPQSSIGDVLRTARENSGRALQDIARQTKIRAEYLKALEEGNYGVLPERPFTRSYLQRYAAELGVDAGALLAEFDRAVPQKPEIAKAMRGQLGTRRGPTVPVGAIAAIISATAVLGVLGWGGYAMWQARSGVDDSPVEVTVPMPSQQQVQLTVNSVPKGARVYLDNRLIGLAPVQGFPLEARRQSELRVELAGYKTVVQNVPLDGSRTFTVELQPTDSTEASTMNNQSKPAAEDKTLPTAPATPAQREAAEVTPPPAPTSNAAPKPPSNAGVKLRFSGPSWIRVTDATGKVLYEGIPAVGSERTFPAGVKVRAGSAGAVQVMSGEGASPLGEPGRVVTRQFP